MTICRRVLFLLALIVAAGSFISALPQRTPISLGVLVDSGSRMSPMMPMARAGFDGFVQSLAADDEVFIMTFGSTTGEIADFTKDKASLATKMAQIGTRGDASLYAGLDAASKKVQQGKNPRKVLLVLTSGNITPADFGRSKEMIEKYKLPVHFIGLSVDCGPCEANPKNLAKLAAGTFGGLTKMEGQKYTVIPAFLALLEVLNK